MMAGADRDAFVVEHGGEVMRVRAGDSGMIAVPMIGPEDAALGDVALVFSALPHGTSAEWVGQVLDAGARVVDLSSDLRPGRGGSTQAMPASLPETVPYGLPELSREGIAGARAVANPGCYPTSVLVALAPRSTSSPKSALRASPNASTSCCNTPRTA